MDKTIHTDNSKKNYKEMDENSLNEFKKVINALKNRGYNPAGQLSGYFISAEPAYITNFENARAIMSRYDRYDLLEMVIQFYIDNADWEFSVTEVSK